MSLQRSYRTKIVLPRTRLVQGTLNVPDTPATKLLRDAMEKAAKDHGGSLESAYHDCLGKMHRCWLAVRTPAFKRGVGVRFGAEGQVFFSYDAEAPAGGQTAELIGQAPFLSDRVEVAEELCREIAHHYAVLAVVAVMRSLGCTVRVRSSINPEPQTLVAGEYTGGRVQLARVDPVGGIFLDMTGYSGDSCIPAEESLRRGLGAVGLRLEVLSHRRKEGDDPTGLRHDPQTLVGGGE